jgi:hypothetical protein
VIFLSNKEEVLRHGVPVAHVFIPTESDKSERELYDLSKKGGINELFKLAKENNELLKKILKRLDNK